jgi:hypothetical protein
MRLVLFVVVLALAVLGALSQGTYPPTINPGADGWHSCGVAANDDDKCHDFGDWDVSGKEYLVMMKTMDNKKLQLTRIASGKTAICNVDFFGGSPADPGTGGGHDCYFTEVDGTFIKNPVSAKGWSDTEHVRDQLVTLPPGLWAIKYQTKGDKNNYVVGLAGADNWAQHFCRDNIVGMTYGTSMQWVKELWSPVSGPKEMDGLCIVSKEPVIAAEHMDFFDEFARKGQRGTIPFSDVTKKGVIVRMGNHRSHKWQYAQIHEYKEGQTIYCHSNTFKMVEADGDVCEFFNPPPNYMPTFYNNFGKWVLKASQQGFPGGDPLRYTITTSVTSTKGSELSEEWGEALTKSIEVSVEYGGVGGSVGLSAEQSKSVSEGVSTELSRGGEESVEIPCHFQEGKNYAAIYVWQVTGSEMNPSQTLPDSTYDIQSIQAACVDSPNPPCCPPGFTTDINCHDDKLPIPFVVADDCKKFTKARPTLR